MPTALWDGGRFKQPTLYLRGAGGAGEALAWREEPEDGEEVGAWAPCFERGGHQAGSQQEALNKGEAAH